MLHADSRKLGQAAPLKDQERALQVLQKNWQDLIKPTKLNVSLGRDPQRFATVVAGAALLLRYWRQVAGQGVRHDIVLPLAGAMLHGGWEPDAVRQVLCAVFQVAADG